MSSTVAESTVTLALKGHPVSDPLLQIRNHHSLACGDPPIVNGDDPNVYLGYFENAFGEQWVFSFHKAIGIVNLLPRQRNATLLCVPEVEEEERRRDRGKQNG